MRIEGTRTFAAPPDAVFAALVDPQLVASSVPGVHSFEVESPDRWRGTVGLPIGAKVSFVFELVERSQPSRARLVATGKMFGASVRVDTAFDLTPAPEESTLMRYSADVTLTGLLSHLPPSALRPVAELQVTGVMRAVEKRLATHAR